MSKLTEKLNKVVGGSPLESGTKYETADLVGKIVHFQAVDSVEYFDEEKGENVKYSVWALSDGYYRGGQQLNEIHAAICEDEELEEEFLKFGLTVMLTLTKTKAGTQFVKVAILENKDNVEDCDVY